MPLALRVAISSPLAVKASRAAAIAAFQSGGNRPSLRRSNSSRSASGACFTRSAQASLASRPFAPISRHAFSSGAGISNGGECQPSSWRAPAISSAPGASLCAFWVPARVGKPKPMMVRQAISVGWPLGSRAVAIAPWIASVSWPSISSTRQPEARKRSTSLSETASVVGPSIEIELLSQNAISLSSFRWPASEIASWLTPSIRQPSPRNT